MGTAGPISLEPRPITARELQSILHAEREGAPFFAYRTQDRLLQVVRLPSERRELTVGRNPDADLSFGWDEQVSALHAVVEVLAGELTLRDDGLSRNGSYVNGERVHGMRRLRDGDMLRFGQTLVHVRNPVNATRRATSAAPRQDVNTRLSDQQRRVLIALCRPLKHGGSIAAPATNQQIADELHLSVPAVKLHLRALSEKLGIASLPQNQKRLALAQSALRGRLITERDLRADPSPPRGG